MLNIYGEEFTINLEYCWHKYKEAGDIDSRNELILYFSDFVKKVVKEVHYNLPRSVDINDLESYGFIGLIDAIKKFNTDKKIKFETYANFRIRGAIYDGIRKLDWLPRTLRAEVKKYNEEKEKSSENRIKINNAGKNSAKAQNFVMLSLDDPNYGIKGAPDRFENNNFTNGPETPDFSGKIDNEIFLKNIVSKLSGKERKIIYLYYFKGKTFKEIGQIINVTESRISQIHKEALLILKKNISKVPEKSTH